MGNFKVTDSKNEAKNAVSAPKYKVYDTFYCNLERRDIFMDWLNSIEKKIRDSGKVYQKQR